MDVGDDGDMISGVTKQTDVIVIIHIFAKTSDAGVIAATVIGTRLRRFVDLMVTGGWPR